MSRELLRSQLRTVGVVAVAAALATATAGCQAKSTAAKVGSDAATGAVVTGGAPATSGSAPAAAAKSFKVGDQVQAGKWVVNVHKATFPYTSTNEFDKPKDGDAYLLLDVEVKNTDKASQSFSSLLSFQVKDSANHTYTETIIAGAGDAQVPDGDLAPGEAKRGDAVFEIPKDAKGLTLSFQGDLLDGTKAVIALGK